MIPTDRRFAPWRDRNGRLSPLRVVVFAALWLPAMDLVRRWATADLGPRPLNEAIHVSGDWAVRLLLVAVLVSPLRHLSGSARLIGIRRMIGIAALAYTLLHVGLWGVDLGWRPATLAYEIAVRPYLAIGFAALAGLVALGATSTDGMVTRLGVERWKRLHRLVHPILILALVHLFLQSKLDLAQGAILTGIAGGGLAARMMVDRRMALGAGAVVLVTLAACIFAATAEAIWFALKTGRAIWPFLAANVDFTARVAPAWWAGAITAVTAGGAIGFRRPWRTNRGIADEKSTKSAGSGRKSAHS